MIFKHGFFWPKGSESYCKRYVNRTVDMEVAMKYVRSTDVVIQAGGHCGVWPHWLSKRFDCVYTFEPDYRNFQCLVANTGDNVFPARGILGNRNNTVGLRVSEKNIGGHKVRGEGNIPCYQIDHLNLSPDLVVLDVEGCELETLRGAENTLKSNRPVIMLEDRDHGESPHDYLVSLGYEFKEKVKHDKIYA